MNKFLSPEELQQLLNYRTEANRFASILGEITYQKTLIEFELEDLKVGLKDNAKKQQDYLKELGKKYGDGTINFETGEITPM